MSRTITHYTTHDLDYYYADLSRTYRLAEEERYQLAVTSSQAASQQERQQAQHQLIESYLRYAKQIALKLCPSSQAARLLPDLIGEINLTLVEMVVHADLSTREEITPYLGATMKGKVKSVLSHDGLIHVPYAMRVRAREHGTPHHRGVFEPVLSLDKQMELEHTDEVEEVLVHTPLPTESAPERDPEQRAQVERYLSYLSTRAQQVLRLRYGLCDEDEHCHSTPEIMQVLGLSRDVVLTTEWDAMQRLRALLVEGKATLIMRAGKPTISYPQISTRHISREEESMLMQAYLLLQAQEGYVSAPRLSQATGVSAEKAATFLRRHQAERPGQAREQTRQRRLEQAYKRLLAQGKRPNCNTLAKEARVRVQTAVEFLKARRGEEESHA